MNLIYTNIVNIVIKFYYEWLFHRLLGMQRILIGLSCSKTKNQSHEP
jgi:hypothetical protein